MRSATVETIQETVQVPAPPLTRLARWCSAAGMAAVVALALGGLILIAQGLYIHAKAMLAQILLERAFAQALATGTPVKPWSWADTAPVARITVARLGVRDIVLGGGSGQAMAFGPTLLPAGAGAAEEGTTILAAHRDTHFAFLRDLRVGDGIGVQAVSGKARRYRVTGMQIVRWDRFAFPRDPARPMLALASCYPFGATRHGPLRYVVWAEAL